MFIFKFLQSILMPSAFIFLFLFFGVLFYKRKKKWSVRFFIIGIICYYLFSITPVSDFLLMPLEEKYRTLPTEEVDRAQKAVLLLGGKESNVLRGNEALRLWHISGEGMRIIISGTDPLIPTSEEAQAVRAFFISRGVDPDDITVEGRSHNTRENVINVQEIVGEEAFFLVTSAYHMERSVREFARRGVEPIPAPTDFKRKRVSSYGLFDFIPNAQNLRNSDLAFHEHMGTIYYRLIFLFGAE